MVGLKPDRRLVRFERIGQAVGLIVRVAQLIVCRGLATDRVKAHAAADRSLRASARGDTEKFRARAARPRFVSSIFTVMALRQRHRRSFERRYARASVVSPLIHSRYLSRPASTGSASSSGTLYG